MERKKWSREELIVAFNVYCKIPFSKINHKHKLVIELANAIHRTPSAVAWKLVNFASLDVTLKSRNIKGASNTSKLDKLIFEEFYQNWDKLVYESEIILNKLLNRSWMNIDITQIKMGKTKETLVKTRVNQSFFRSAVLATYENRCCVTNISISELLIASHIVPWSIDKKNRMNPENGLCLNVIHDKAFDLGLITIGMDYRIKVSKKIKEFKQEENIQMFLLNFENKQINLPKRFLPDLDFLKYHNQNIFNQ